jgi:putative ABC transport system permease protein
MHNEKVNRWLRFLRWFCPASLYEGIEGDLLEQLEEDVEAFGERKARRKLTWNVLRFFRPGIILRNSFSKGLINTIMLRSYFKIAVRNIMKRKLYASINALGLAIGIAACLLIYLFVQDERSFDQFHANKDLIYRMQGEMYDSHEESNYLKHAYMQLALASTLKAEVPEVQYATQFVQQTDFFRYDHTVLKSRAAYVAKDFFRMFSFDLLEGSSADIFNDNDEVVLTEAAATKYFGSQNPLGKVLSKGANGEKLYRVTGIVANPPGNSSLDFDMLLPIESMGNYGKYNLEHWMNQGFPTFVQLQENATTGELSGKLDAIIQKYMKQDLEEWARHIDAPEGTDIYKIGFSKLSDIHMQKEVGWHKVSDPQYSYILGGIAILILVIACINYVSLAMTSSASRRKEVGVRKVAGAFRKQLIWQFGFESSFLTFLAMLLGLVIVIFFLPTFNEFTDKTIALSAAHIWPIATFCMVITIVIGSLAGAYPALYLSGLRPSIALKSGFAARMQSFFVKPLVVLQFAFSSFLMISSVIMYRQMEYVTTKDLGFDTGQVVVIPTHGSWKDDESNKIVERFRQLASVRPTVVSVAGTSNPIAFGEDYMVFGGYKVDGVPRQAYGFLVDEQFASTMGLEFVEGRNFDERMISDAEESIIVNEALVKDLGWDDPLSKRMNFHASDTAGLGARVIGVVKDFHFLSLEQKIAPMFLYATKRENLSYMVVKIAPTDWQSTMAGLQADFEQAAPGKPFEYTFLDEKVAQQYTSYKRWMDIMSLATGLAILIAGLGLFGLAGINAVNKTKEIGIRKVLGARIVQVFVLLNRQYVILASIAFALAMPLSWYVMGQWLSGFVYAISITWQLFAVSMLTGIVIALVAVSYHAIRASAANPTESLRYE